MKKYDDRTRLAVARLARAGLAEKLVAARAEVGERAASQENPSLALARVRRIEDELLAIEASIPVLERRIGDAERAAEDKARAERKRVHDAALARRAKAAAKVDDALRAVEAAFVEYADVSGIETEHARNLVNAQRGGLIRAAAHSAPTFWEAAGCRFVDSNQRMALAERP